MATNYPLGLDTLTNPAPGDSTVSPSHAGQHANANDAIEAIEAELGTSPSGVYTTVRERFEAIEASGGGATTTALQSTGGATIPATLTARAFATIAVGATGVVTATAQVTALIPGTGSACINAALRLLDGGGGTVETAATFTQSLDTNAYGDARANVAVAAAFTGLEAGEYTVVVLVSRTLDTGVAPTVVSVGGFVQH